MMRFSAQRYKLGIGMVWIKIGIILSVIVFFLSCSMMDSTYYPYCGLETSEDELEKQRRYAMILGLASAAIFFICLYFARVYDVWGLGIFGGLCV